MNNNLTDELEVLEKPGLQQSEAQDELDTDVQQFVIFMTEGEVFAVNMAPVQEIIRVPEVVRVPMAPRSLNGLSNLRGKVLPIISLRRIFGFQDLEHDDATRAIVIDQGQALGFVVDRVLSVIGIESRLIEDVSALEGTVDTELLSGLLKNISGHEVVMVLDFARLIEKEFAAISALGKSAASRSLLSDLSSSEEDEDLLSDELQLVSFEVAGQEYAVAIEEVQEIVQVPEKVIHVPHSESHVLGLMMLRNRLLPLVSLRAMFGLPQRSADEHSRIVVISVGSASVGIVMDTVNEVLRVPCNSVDDMPGLLMRDGDLSEISRICRLDKGKRLVSIISAEHMFKHSAVKEALAKADQMDKEQTSLNTDEGEGHDDEEQVVVFRLHREEFGVPIASVQEIVRVPEELTQVPKAPAFVEGVINLRGSVLPVIDQRLRLGLDSSERNDRQRIMVYLFGDVRMGFIVDSVTEVLKIPKSMIEESPQLSDEQHSLIGRVANMEKSKRMIQLIDPSRLIDRQDIAGLNALCD
ncbi:MAG TPA: chemotaxis protein CheW [Limnobacter sp.]|nr:chemotaxis protein CheW [Limnobacter sp.]